MKRILNHNYVTRIFCRYNSTKKWPLQIFSAIQPTGEAHLGNYLGALKRWVDLQNSKSWNIIYAIADLHSITIPKDPSELQNNILSMTATLLACGIDTDKAILFQQSKVPQHTELCWILGTLTTMARLSHLPQFKEKCELVKDAPTGIFLYPVLQAADIMIYRTTHVPVGEDQVQQIELAQHLVKIFNNRFGDTFPTPNVIIDSSSGRIKSLSDPKKKMSKSDLKETATISLMDEPDVILRKCKKAVTDFTSKVTYEPEERHGVSNLILIHSGISGKSPKEIVEESANLDTGKYKLVLAEVIIEHLNPIRKKIIEYLNAEDYLISVLQRGAEKAQEIAEATMKEVREKMGFDIMKGRRGHLIMSTSELWVTMVNLDWNCSQENAVEQKPEVLEIECAMFPGICSPSHPILQINAEKLLCEMQNDSG